MRKQPFLKGVKEERERERVERGMYFSKQRLFFSMRSYGFFLGVGGGREVLITDEFF